MGLGVPFVVHKRINTKIMKLSLLLLIGVEARRRLRTNRDCFDLDTTDDLNGYTGSDFERIAGKLDFVEFWPHVLPL